MTVEETEGDAFGPMFIATAAVPYGGTLHVLGRTPEEAAARLRRFAARMEVAVARVKAKASR